MGAEFWSQKEKYESLRGLSLPVVLPYCGCSSFSSPRVPLTAASPGALAAAPLKQDLDGCDRSRTPWLVAMFHCPWHNSN
ncbi:unnamed protein product, partial [Ectocarpus sp. 12 AP-2014]